MNVKLIINLCLQFIKFYGQRMESCFRPALHCTYCLAFNFQVNWQILILVGPDSKSSGPTIKNGPHKQLNPRNKCIFPTAVYSKFEKRYGKNFSKIPFLLYRRIRCIKLIYIWDVSLNFWQIMNVYCCLLM